MLNSSSSEQPPRLKDGEKKRAWPKWLRSPRLLRMVVKLGILLYRLWLWWQDADGS